VKKAIKSPAKILLENAGYDSSIILGKLEEKGDENYGFDALKGNFTDMIAAGIIDPTKVIRCALTNAASVAGMMLTSEATIVEIKEKEK